LKIEDFCDALLVLVSEIDEEIDGVDVIALLQHMSLSIVKKMTEDKGRHIDLTDQTLFITAIINEIALGIDPNFTDKMNLKFSAAGPRH